MTLTIGLLGDVMMGRLVAERLAAVPPAAAWSAELRALARSCDLVVCNLECCVSARGEPTGLVPGKPFFFRAPPRAVGALRAIGVRAVGLANNHALDFGPDALADTVANLRWAGIEPAGAGRGPERARRGIAAGAGGARVGLVAVSDHPPEFAAGPGAWGIAHADLRPGPPPWLAGEIARLRADCDLVIAFPHWGPNMSDRPAPWQRSATAGLVDAGADLVAGHSAHLFGGVERIGGSLVAYDLGDALDDYATDPELRNDLGLMALWHPHEPERRLELVGLALGFCRTGLAHGEDADWIGRRLEEACAALGTRIERVGEQRFALVEQPPQPGTAARISVIAARD